MKLVLFIILLMSGVIYFRSPQIISYDKRAFRLENEGMTYHGELFSGILLHESSKKRRTTPYSNGQIHGLVLEFYKANEQISKKAYYAYGRKVGVHEGYFPSGALKFRSHYHDGVYDGEVIQWYESGQKYSYTLYDNGKLVGHKLWRENGRIYSNYVYKNGRKLGLDGGKLCFTAEDIEQEI